MVVMSTQSRCAHDATSDGGSPLEGDPLAPIQWCEAHKGLALRTISVWDDDDPLGGNIRTICPKCVGLLRRIGLIVGHLDLEPQRVSYRMVDGRMPPHSDTAETLPIGASWFELPGTTDPGIILMLNLRGYLVTR